MLINSSVRLNSSSDKRINKEIKRTDLYLSFFMFVFLLKGQKKNEHKRKDPFNVSLTLHWASLRNLRRCTDDTTTRNIEIWLVPLGTRQKLKFELLIL